MDDKTPTAASGKSGAVTELLGRIRAGDRDGLGQLVELIYPDLRRLARAQLRHEPSGHILQPTALVNEAYLRLVGTRERKWVNRNHFFGAARQTMRRVLVDIGRARRVRERILPAAVRGVNVDGLSGQVEVLALNAALARLEERSVRQAQVVRLRYFDGLSIPEVADVLGTTARTVDRDWAIARAWLRLQLNA
jgi:RNA polymerase sigma factor (TIGR02999 family)